MTREDILNIKFNRELDELIGKEIFGYTIKTHECALFVIDGKYSNDIDRWITLPRYTNDLNVAWKVFQEVSTWIFSKRKKFFDTLQSFTRIDSTSMVGWPDVLIVLKDRMLEAICKAALIAKLEGEN
jgi:hypothetical protein